MLSKYEYLKSLGEYVYYFQKPDGTKLYGGRGIGSRCLDHIKEKDYDYNWLYILAHNLEKFDKAYEAIESMFLLTNNFEDNKQPAQYKELFIMANFDFMYEQEKESHRDLSRELVQFVSNPESSFFPYITKISVSHQGSPGIKLWSPSHRKKQMWLEAWLPENSEQLPWITILIDPNYKDRLKAFPNFTKAFKQANPKIEVESETSWLRYYVNSKEDLAEEWKSFFSS